MTAVRENGPIVRDVVVRLTHGPPSTPAEKYSAFSYPNRCCSSGGDVCPATSSSTRFTTDSSAIREQADRSRQLPGKRLHRDRRDRGEWMTAEPVAVAVQAPIEVAVALMAEHGIHHLPVVEGERAVGMLGFRQAAQARGTSLGLGF